MIHFPQKKCKERQQNPLYLLKIPGISDLLPIAIVDQHPQPIG